MTGTHRENSPGVLAQRPDARVFKIENFLPEILAGRIRVPPFQRGLRWNRDDALRLIDSIYRGYPIGTLLLWEIDAPAAAVRFGSVSVDAPTRSDAWWIVDGQQRIVSLARVLLASRSPADEFALFFDLDELEFVPSAASSSSDASRWLPLTEVLDSERLFQWVVQTQGGNARRREHAFQLGKRIREYDVPAYVVRTGSEKVLREIFDRVNSTGKRLNDYEVFEALHSARSGEKPQSLDQIADELDELQFGRVENKILYRLLRVLQGVDIVERSQGKRFRLSEDVAAAAYRETAEVAARVIQFLKKDAGIPHYSLLPYKQPFVTLGKFFSIHRTPAARSRDLLVRWLWRGALNGTHKGDTVSARGALAMIDPRDEAGSVARMLDTSWPFTAVLPAAVDRFNFRFAGSKLEVLALLDLLPRDLVTGEPFDVGTQWKVDEASSEMPLPSLFDSRIDAGLLQSAANRIVHVPRVGLRKALSRVSDEAVLFSHGIGPAAISALSDGRRDDFLLARADTLGAHMSRFFQRRARLHEDDRPSLSSLLVEDD